MEQNFKIEIGSRIIVKGETCTVKWKGILDGTHGLRMGVEWDDPQRGKHSGEYQDKKYFNVKVPNSGSFLKYPNDYEQCHKMGIETGIGFMEAIKRRYIDSEGIEDISVALEGNSKVKIESRGWKEAQERLSDPTLLKIISFGETYVGRIEKDLDFSNILLGLQELDLSKCLINSWLPILDLIRELPNLRILHLNKMRMEPVTEYDVSIHVGSLDRIKVLSLNYTIINNDELFYLSRLLNNLEELNICGNNFKTIPTSLNREPWFFNLRSLNLESNLISGQTIDILNGLDKFPKLEYLNLGFNPLTKLFDDYINKVYSLSLKRLNLSYTQIKDYKQIAYIYKGFPGLENLQINGAPLHEVNDGIYFPSNTTNSIKDSSRTLITALIPNLKSLNLSPISKQDRIDSELYYINQICKPQINAFDNETFTLYHPRFDSLFKSYGLNTSQTLKDDTVAYNTKSNSTLKNRLINLELILMNTPPQSNQVNFKVFKDPLFQPVKSIKKEFLNNATVRVLEITIKKLFKLDPRAKFKLYALIPVDNIHDLNCALQNQEGEAQVIELDNPIRQLVSFYNLNDNCLIWTVIN